MCAGLGLTVSRYLAPLWQECKPSSSTTGVARNTSVTRIRPRFRHTSAIAHVYADAFINTIPAHTICRLSFHRTTSHFTISLCKLQQSETNYYSCHEQFSVPNLRGTMWINRDKHVKNHNFVSAGCTPLLFSPRVFFFLHEDSLLLTELSAIRLKSWKVRRRKAPSRDFGGLPARV